MWTWSWFFEWTTKNITILFLASNFEKLVLSTRTILIVFENFHLCMHVFFSKLHVFRLESISSKNRNILSVGFLWRLRKCLYNLNEHWSVLNIQQYVSAHFIKFMLIKIFVMQVILSFVGLNFFQYYAKLLLATKIT